MGRVLGVGFLGLAAVSTLVPGAERLLNAVAGGSAALAVGGLVCYLVGFAVLYWVGERRARWECVRPLAGLPDPDTGKPYRVSRRDGVSR